MTACRSRRFDLPARAAWGSAVFVVLLAGCGAEGDLATVKGKVTLNGQPLQGALVEFQPADAGGSPSSGMTDADGNYRLMYTFDKAGAKPGEHTVTIRTGGIFLDKEGCEVECAERIPPRYNTRTELKRTVDPGRNTMDFDL